jgi:hypothetical protein
MRCGINTSSNLPAATQRADAPRLKIRRDDRTLEIPVACKD